MSYSERFVPPAPATTSPLLPIAILFVGLILLWFLVQWVIQYVRYRLQRNNSLPAKKNKKKRVEHDNDSNSE
jgi:flagellar biosynthesis/type III secretory pathway M-ring protein FliF/YscJ